MRFLFLVLIFSAAFSLAGGTPRIIYSAQGGKVKSFDPVLADDLGSFNIIGALYDTLVQYDYARRPYTLKCSMLAEMPVFSKDFRSCRFKLRSDLRFAAHPLFKGSIRDRKITTDDVFFSLKRLCDVRKNSPLYWILRGKIVGMEKFRQAAAKAEPYDFAPYDLPIEGMVKHNEHEFTLKFTSPQPRFLYLLAMPSTAIVSRRAEVFYKDRFDRNPVSSGPFLLKSHIRDHKLHLVRNPDFRKEFFREAATAADRNRPLPLADEILLYTVKQPVTAWLLFLQGKIDYNAIGKDDADLVAGGDLPQALQKRKIKLLRSPAFEIRYIGFNCNDPLLRNNKKLRQALSLAYNVEQRILHANNQLLRAHSPIPPGVAGHDEKYRSPWGGDDLQKAKTLLAEAGFPGGIDPATKKPLRLTFDQSGDTTSHRQIAELTQKEFKALGIELECIFNFKPRFFDRLRRNRMQLFRLSWTGDYPDAENFLQLFYSGNAGSCNRTGFSSKAFDRLYEKIIAMPDSPEREKLCAQAAKLAAEEAPWIFEGYPVSYQLLNPWLENFLPHDFEFTRLKYLSVDPAKREKIKKQFRPLNFSELR
jgi:ABC-type transport system substrate-binding protein